MSRYTLLGFVGPLREQAQDVVSYHLPLVEDSSNRLLVATRADWNENDLRPVRDNELEFFTHLDEASVQICTPGTVVLLAGATFYNNCSRIPSLKSFADVFHAWDVLAGPFSWRAGSRSEFRQLNQRMFSAAKGSLHEALFARHEMVVPGAAELLFWVVDRLSDVDMAELLRTKALYFWERRDLERFELLEVQAKGYGFAKPGSFRAALEHDVQWLIQQRLSEMGATAAHGGPARIKYTVRGANVHRTLIAGRDSRIAHAFVTYSKEDVAELLELWQTTQRERS